MTPIFDDRVIFHDKLAIRVGEGNSYLYGNDILKLYRNDGILVCKKHYGENIWYIPNQLVNMGKNIYPHPFRIELYGFHIIIPIPLLGLTYRFSCYYALGGETACSTYPNNSSLDVQDITARPEIKKIMKQFTENFLAEEFSSFGIFPFNGCVLP